jgi:probable HAF family extracellular repeat protein
MPFRFCLFNLLLATPVLAASSYSITLISSPSPSVLVQPRGINDSGEIVGDISPGGSAKAFLFIGGTLTTFAPDTISSSVAYAVNKSGQIAGFGGPFSTAFIFNPDGTFTQLGTLGGPSSEAFGINDLGHVVGTSATTGGFFPHGFLYTGGPLIGLGTLGGHTSAAISINNSDQIAGYSDTFGGGRHAFLYSNGTLQDLQTLGGPESQASAINNSGIVVGTSDINGGSATHAFLYVNGAMTDLGTLGTNSYATSINANGDIVGYSDITASPTTTHAFLYRAGALTDLNTLIDPASGWTLQTAAAINNAGQITGTGTLNGTIQAYLLTPALPTITMEIKPGSAQPVPIQPNSHGVIPVAILGSADFAVSNVDLTTVRFGPGGAENVGTPQYRDINDDGFPDVVLQFRAEASGFQCGNTTATLSLETFAGQRFSGQESIATVGCERETFR